MARADTVTWLSLDRFAAILGLDPMHFNGIYSALRPDGASCSDLFMQYAWQDHDSISREDIARAIHDAERRIARYMGYPLLPDWVKDERHRATMPYRAELVNGGGMNTRGFSKSIDALWNYVISGGQKAKTLISSAAAIVRSDGDGDGYNELCTVTVTTTADACEARVFIPGKSGADEWEVRPITVVDNGATLTITFKIWQVPEWERWEGLAAAAIDGDVITNFETTVDVYRVWNDPQSPAEFLWELPSCSACGGSGCTACVQGSQAGCLTVRDTRLGTLAYHPGTWDADTSTFEVSEWAEYREPDRLRLWYYAGWRDESRACPTAMMDPALERAVAYYAMALLDRPLCSCDSASSFAERWREDLALVNASRSFQNGVRVLDNPFGTQAGAVYAWGVANEELRKVGR